MTRLTSLAVLGASLVLASPAFAQGQAEIASKLNDEGKELMYAGNYAEAAAKFRDASARAPEAKYFYNLYITSFQLGKFPEALTACNAAEAHQPTADQSSKIAKLEQKIRDEAKAQNIDLQPAGGGGGDPNVPIGGDPSVPTGGDPGVPTGGDPNAPTGQPPPPQVVGRPPAENLFAGTTPDNKYTWTLGADLFGGGGTIGQDGFYGSAGAGFRLKGDYLLRPASRIGAQGYIQYTSFTKGDDQAGMDPYSLSIVDLGLALYKHICLTGTDRLCITPLAGAQIAMMSPANEQNGVGDTVFNYMSLGLRFEVGAHYAFGKRMEHVLGIGVGANVYSGVFSESMEAVYSSEAVGLDKGGAAGYVSVGYTYRFNTPFGSSPFVTLE